MGSGCEICGLGPAKIQTVDGLRGVFCGPCADRMKKPGYTGPLIVSTEATFRG